MVLSYVLYDGIVRQSKRALNKESFQSLVLHIHIGVTNSKRSVGHIQHMMLF